MARLLLGKKLADRLKEKTKQKLAPLKTKPTLAIVSVGDNPAAVAYSRLAKRQMKKFGLPTAVYWFPGETGNGPFQKRFAALNADPKNAAIMVMRPLPGQINLKQTASTIAPTKDIDSLSTKNLGLAFLDQPQGFTPMAAQAVIDMLTFYQIPLAGKNVAVIGDSLLVGRPLSAMLLAKNATVTTLNTYSKNLTAFTRRADIVVTAAGEINLLKASMVKSGVVVVDVGINFTASGQMVGDADFSGIFPKAFAINPVPGGIGTVTNAMLPLRVVEATYHS